MGRLAGWYGSSRIGALYRVEGRISVPRHNGGVSQRCRHARRRSGVLRREEPHACYNTEAIAWQTTGMLS